MEDEEVAELHPHDALLTGAMDRRERRHTVYGTAVELLADEGYLRYGA